MYFTTDGQALREQIRRFIEDKTSSEFSFEDLAILLFRYQYEKNFFYRQFVDSIVDPRRVEHWTEIPPIPVSMFKEFHLRSYKPDASELVWHSSGTTGKMSRTYLANPAMYNTVVKKLWEQHVIPMGFKGDTLKLIPEAPDWKNSSLAHFFYQGEMAEYKESRRAHPIQDYNFWVNLSRKSEDEGKDFTLDIPLFKHMVVKSIDTKIPLRIVGTSYAVVWLLDSIVDDIQLPEGSMVIDTGGYKGKSTEYTRTDFLKLIEKKLGIPPTMCLNEYGMSELSSHCWSVFPLVPKPVQVDQYKTYNVSNTEIWEVPYWMRVRMVDPVSLRDSDDGVAVWYDLANVWSVFAIQTEDLGFVLEEGQFFIPRGRAKGSDLKGCSITAEKALGGNL